MQKGRRDPFQILKQIYGGILDPISPPVEMRPSIPIDWVSMILNFLINVKDRRNDAVQVQYRNTKDNVREINLDARVKTIPPLYLLGAFYYNLLAGTWVQSIFGVEYQAQCWSAGFIFENINQSPDGTQPRDRKFHFYFNLLNLGSVGHEGLIL